VEADFATLLFQADEAMDFMRGQQIAMLPIAETTVWATELPIGLDDPHHTLLLG